MDSITLENFINYCDDMMIANEGEINGDGKFHISNIGKVIMEKIRIIWGKFIGFIKKVKEFFKKKFGKDRVKPKDEIARLEKELAELKRSSVAKDKEIDSLYNQRRYLVNERNSLRNDLSNSNSQLEMSVREKEDKISKLQKDISAMRSVSSIMDYLDTDISNYCKIKQVHIKNAKHQLEKWSEDLKYLISHPDDASCELPKYKNDSFDDFSFKDGEAEKYLEKINKHFDGYKQHIKDVSFSARGRFQNYYLYQNIELLTSRVTDMENYKKQLEEIIDMIDRIPDTCKSKPGFKNTVLTFFTIWSTNISQTQMLINKLTELTNGNIDHVM